METLAFDTHQFADHKSHAVRADYVGAGEWDSTGIDFTDYQRMGIQARAIGASRKVETPTWALKDSLLMDTLVRYLEKRAYLRIGPGDHKQRLDRVRVGLSKLATRKNALLTNLCQRYVALKNATPPDVLGMRILGREIEGLDTDLRMMVADCPGIILRVVYLYYRYGWDSVAIGKEMKLKPPHVRQIIWRMDLTGDPDRNRQRGKFTPLAESDCILAIKLRRQGMNKEQLRKALKSSDYKLTRSLELYGFALPAMPEHTRKQARIDVNPARAIHYWNKGESLEQIAERFVGVARRDVWRAIDYGIRDGHWVKRPLIPEKENGPSLAA